VTVADEPAAASKNICGVPLATGISSSVEPCNVGEVCVLSLVGCSIALIRCTVRLWGNELVGAGYPPGGWLLPQPLSVGATGRPRRRTLERRRQGALPKWLERGGWERVAGGRQGWHVGGRAATPPRLRRAVTAAAGPQRRGLSLSAGRRGIVGGIELVIVRDDGARDGGRARRLR
jgi:hypothetical protein